MSIKDLIEGGCAVQGMVHVIFVPVDGRMLDVYDGEGADMPCDEKWCHEEINFLYYDGADKRLTFEVFE